MKTVWISETNHHEVLLNLALDLLKTCWSFEKLHQAIDTIFYPIIYDPLISALNSILAPFFQPTQPLSGYYYRSADHVECLIIMIIIIIILIILIIIIIIIIIFISKDKNTYPKLQ